MSLDLYRHQVLRMGERELYPEIGDCHFEQRIVLQGCGFDTVGSAAAYSNASDFLMYFTQVLSTATF